MQLKAIFFSALIFLYLVIIYFVKQEKFLTVTLTLFWLNETSPDSSHLLYFFVCWINPHGGESWYFARVLAIKWALMKCQKFFEKPHCFVWKALCWTNGHWITSCIYPFIKYLETVNTYWTAWLICSLGHRKLNRVVSGPRTGLWGYQQILM